MSALMWWVLHYIQETGVGGGGKVYKVELLHEGESNNKKDRTGKLGMTGKWHRSKEQKCRPGELAQVLWEMIELCES